MIRRAGRKSISWRTFWSKSRRSARQADQELAAVANPAELEQFRIKFLGVKGSIKGLMKLLGQIPKEQKPARWAEDQRGAGSGERGI